MFGIGAQEMVIIALLFLVIFGPGKLPQMARDAGRLMGEARRAMDEFREELTSAADDEPERTPARKTKTSRSRSKKEAPEENGRVSEDEEEYDL